MNPQIANLIKGKSLLTLLLKMKGQIDSRSEAEETYHHIYPVLEELLAKGYAFESPEIQGIVEVLRGLPAWGAKRQNFEKRYLKNEAGLRELPRDPRNFYGKGLWH